MRNVIYAAWLSLDGYIDAARGDPDWMFPDEQLHRHFNELEAATDTHLYGRRMYELMAAYWPTADEDPAAPPWVVEYAGIRKPMPKVVFPKTLERVDWNSRLVRGDAAEEVARLKAQPGGNMCVGGAALAASLADAGLIDEYRLYYVPVILGGGRPIFGDVRERIQLSLVETRRFASGVVLLRYRRATDAPQGEITDHGQDYIG